MTYNRFIQGLKAAGVEVDRRMLAELAVNDAPAFATLVEAPRSRRRPARRVDLPSRRVPPARAEPISHPLRTIRTSTRRPPPPS
jgi:hypothetical protein